MVAPRSRTSIRASRAFAQFSPQNSTHVASLLEENLILTFLSLLLAALSALAHYWATELPAWIVKWFSMRTFVLSGISCLDVMIYEVVKQPVYKRMVLITALSHFDHLLRGCCLVKLGGPCTKI